MLSRASIVALLILLAGCIDSSPKITGFWVATDHRAIAEFVNDKIIFTFLDSDDDHVVSFEKIDDSRYLLKSTAETQSAIMAMDWDNKRFTLPEKFGGTEVDFTLALTVQLSEISGEWHGYQKKVDVESSSKVLISSDLFELSTVSLNHKIKQYKETHISGSVLIDKGNLERQRKGFLLYQIYL
ncbi:MAG: hypothetical protein V7739_21130 [Motiliproteus sp.]